MTNDTYYPQTRDWKDTAFLSLPTILMGSILLMKSTGKNMVEVGHFDTSPTIDTKDSWMLRKVYPWLPSGNIIASDMEENGMYSSLIIEERVTGGTSN
ncbi:MAG: hypothetical protein R2813_04920 [Flavobacteriales bacterium]